MRSVNKVILIGNLTRDPEMRQTANGQTVTTFCIATNREWITKDSNKHNLAEYHDIVVWAKLAEICNKYLKKGKLVFVEGYLKTRSWDTPEGVRRFKTEIVAQDMIMLEKRPAGSQNEDYIPQEDAGEDNENYTEKEEKESKAPVRAPEKAAEKKSGDSPDSEESKKSAEVDIAEDLGL